MPPTGRGDWARRPGRAVDIGRPLRARWPAPADRVHVPPGCPEWRDDWPVVPGGVEPTIAST